MAKSIYEKPKEVPAKEVLLISIEDAAKRLSMGLTWLREQVDNNEIPFIRMGRKIMFCPEQLTLWIKANMRNAVAGGVDLHQAEQQ